MRFRWKRSLYWVWTEGQNASKCMRFQTRTLYCKRVLKHTLAIFYFAILACQFSQTGSYPYLGRKKKKREKGKRKSNNYTYYMGLSVKQELWTDHKRQENNVCTHDGLTWMWFHFYLFDILYYSAVSWSEDQLLLQLLNKWYKNYELII